MLRGAPLAAVPTGSHLANFSEFAARCVALGHGRVRHLRLYVIVMLKCFERRQLVPRYRQ
jgi:hypothetical protein